MKESTPAIAMARKVTVRMAAGTSPGRIGSAPAGRP